MPALPEYRTRTLLESRGVPLVPGTFCTEIPEDIPNRVVYLKAQIPGATSRAADGLVRRAENPEEITAGLRDLLGRKNCHGVLLADAVSIQKEYYAGCMLDFGSEEKLPGGVVLFSPEGGSGIEQRSGSLIRIPFSLIHPPSADKVKEHLAGLEGASELSEFLAGLIDTFIRYKLTVLETNPIAVLEDGSHIAVDCRAEFEKAGVSKKDKELFNMPERAEKTLTPLEEMVDRVNQGDPAGTGFFRASREDVPEGAVAVATNLCGGGGKMLWEMATGGRDDIFTLNESDTSGGLSAFKSYRILRAIMSQPEAQVLFLTGSGMAFQNQHHLACAVWKALRESPSPLPCLLRFGGTDQDKAFELLEQVEETLPVEIKTFRPEIFPNAMVDEVAATALKERVHQNVKPDDGELLFETETPPAKFLWHPGKRTDDSEPEFISQCPTGYLKWENGRPVPNPEAKCIGCLICETLSLLEGSGELTIELDLPGEVE